MKRRTALLLAFVACSMLVTGCAEKKTTLADRMGESYILLNHESNGKYSQRVYRASGVSVPELAAQVAEQQKPFAMTKSDPEHMFLLYTNQVIHVQKDPVLSADSLVEIDTTEYFIGNYSPVFVAKYIDEQDMALLFGENWKKTANYKKQTYYGYGDYEYRKKFPKLQYVGQYKPKSKSVKMADPSTMKDDK